MRDSLQRKKMRKAYVDSLLFGTWIKEQRNRVGLTILDAAELTGMTTTRIFEIETIYESVDALSDDEAERMAEAYGIDTSAITSRMLDNDLN
jgi:hypothetical protein